MGVEGWEEKEEGKGGGGDVRIEGIKNSSKEILRIKILKFLVVLTSPRSGQNLRRKTKMANKYKTTIWQ